MLIANQLKILGLWFVFFTWIWTGVVELWMMSRPVLLVFLLIVLIITSQFEWRQPLVVDLDATPSISQKQNKISDREEAVKEKVTSLFLIPVFFFVFDYKMEIFIVQNLSWTLWWAAFCIFSFISWNARWYYVKRKLYVFSQLVLVNCKHVILFICVSFLSYFIS